MTYPRSPFDGSENVPLYPSESQSLLVESAKDLDCRFLKILVVVPTNKFVRKKLAHYAKISLFNVLNLVKFVCDSLSKSFKLLRECFSVSFAVTLTSRWKCEDLDCPDWSFLVHAAWRNVHDFLHFRAMTHNYRERNCLKTTGAVFFFVVFCWVSIIRKYV